MAEMPSRAGSPGLGSRVFTAPGVGTARGGRPTKLPTREPAGQMPFSNVAIGHLVAAFGFPTRPGGKCRTTCDGVVAKSAWITIDAWLPACVVDGVTVNAA